MTINLISFHSSHLHLPQFIGSQFSNFLTFMFHFLIFHTLSFHIFPLSCFTFSYLTLLYFISHFHVSHLVISHFHMFTFLVSHFHTVLHTFSFHIFTLNFIFNVLNFDSYFTPFHFHIFTLSYFVFHIFIFRSLSFHIFALSYFMFHSNLSCSLFHLTAYSAVHVHVFHFTFSHFSVSNFTLLFFYFPFSCSSLHIWICSCFIVFCFLPSLLSGSRFTFFFFCPLSLSGSRSGSSFKQCTQMVCHRNTNTEGTSRWWKNQTKATGFSMAMQDLGLVLLGKNKIHWPSSVRFEKTVPSVMSIRPWAILEHSFFPIRTSQLVNSIIMFIPHKILRLWYLVFLASPSRIYLAPPSQISISHI